LHTVISKVDSRTILDSSGADQLVGKGDMLLSTGSDLIRLQCAFVDTPEVDKVTEFIGSQRGYPDAFNLPEYYDDTDEMEKANSILMPAMNFSKMRKDHRTAPAGLHFTSAAQIKTMV